MDQVWQALDQLTNDGSRFWTRISRASNQPLPRSICSLPPAARVAPAQLKLSKLAHMPVMRLPVPERSTYPMLLPGPGMLA